MDLFLPAEWHEQCGVQLTWPHENSDWAPILADVRRCYVAIAREIVKREKLLIVCHSIEEVKKDLDGISLDNRKLNITILDKNLGKRSWSYNSH